MSFIECLDIADLRTLEQGTDEAVREFWMYVLDVGVQPDDDIPLENVQTLPEVFSFAPALAEAG